MKVADCMLAKQLHAQSRSSLHSPPATHHVDDDEVEEVDEINVLSTFLGWLPATWSNAARV